MKSIPSDALIVYLSSVFETLMNDITTHFVVVSDEPQPPKVRSLFECINDTEDFRAFADDVEMQYNGFVRDIFGKIWGGDFGRQPHARTDGYDRRLFHWNRRLTRFTAMEVVETTVYPIGEL